MSHAVAASTTADETRKEGGPPRVFELRFSPTGVLVAALFFALSLFPSLLPRSPVVQGLLSGITVVLGYGLGAGGQWLYDYLQIPKPTGTPRRVVLGVVAVLVALALALSVWQQVGWQNEVRRIFGEDPVGPSTWPVIILTTILVGALILVVSRSIWLFSRFLRGLLGRWLPRRLAQTLGVVSLVLLIWLLVSGVLVNGFFTAANAMFSTTDGTTPDGVVRPTLAERSGSPASLVTWDSLGKEGRKFVASGVTADQVDEFSGGGAQEPIRVFVGLKSAETVQERADLVLAELKRTGAFERQILVLASSTGTGWLDEEAIVPLEYMYNGDTAVAGVQYSYLPSWISLFADQEAVKETSRTVFDTVNRYWRTLPEASRPQLYLYGLSLGSFGAESVLTSIDVVNSPVNGALLQGPPFVNPLHTEVTVNRDPGSPEWLPVYGNGSTVRFMAEQNTLDTPTTEWGPTRLLYMQHNSDPVVFFAWNMSIHEPEWLKRGAERGPDVVPDMRWFPFVTFWQVAADLPTAGGVPRGFGHNYSRQANTEGWAAVTQNAGWSAEDTDRLMAVMTEQIGPSD